MNAPDTLHELRPGVIEQVPIALLKPDPDQPRVKITTASLEALSQDIAARGIELPIVVSADFTIKDGERRWRAAQAAGLDTVPCILAAPVSGETAAVDWRLDQVCDNHHREPLNALDWAKTLHELVAVHGKPVGGLPALLKARGIEMSRSYISNLIRLNDLPAWAKALIARGVLPPAAGKYILMATQHEPAMKKLQQHIEAEAKRLEPDQALRADLGWAVQLAFEKTATELTAQSWERDHPRFAWKTSCAECKTRGQVGGDHFCFNRHCFDQKQDAAEEAAKKKIKAEPGKSTPAKRKLNARELARKHQERARFVAREQALQQIVTKAEKSAGPPDRRLVAMAMIREMQHEHLKTLFSKRGWQPAKNGYGGREYFKVADREIEKLNAAALDGLMMEMALRGNLNVGYFAGNKDYVADTAKRYRIDLKALEKAELARLKAAAAKSAKPPKPKRWRRKKSTKPNKEAKR